MTQHVPNPHTPAEMRRLSNIAHILEGAIISTAGAIAIADAFGRGRYRRIAGTTLAAAGSLLAVGLVTGSLEHGGPRRFFRADHQQRQHLQMAALLTAGGIGSRYGRLGGLLASGTTARIGQMFLTHEQHGTGDAAAVARGRHERLGKTILAAAAAGALGEALGSRAARGLAGALLVASGIQLVAYREPEGAYENERERSAH